MKQKPTWWRRWWWAVGGIVFLLTASVVIWPRIGRMPGAMIAPEELDRQSGECNNADAPANVSEAGPADADGLEQQMPNVWLRGEPMPATEESE